MTTVDDTLKNLAADTEPVSVAALYALSSLERADVDKVRSAWPAIAADRRAAAMRHLVEIAEDNFEVDFGAIYRLGLVDPDPTVRIAAIDGLWEDDDPALIPILLKLLAGEADGVRAAAAGALGRFIYAGELEDLPAEKVAPITKALKAAFADSTQPIDVRRRALESLGFLSFEEVGELVKQGFEHSDQKLRLSAVFAMGRSADDRWGEIAKHELDAGDPEMRYEAARACGELEYAPATRRLTELIDDVDEDVQLVSIWALGQIGGDKARQVLQAVLESDADHLYEEAEAALDELEFKGDRLGFGMFDFEDDDEEWVLDQDVDAEDDEDDD